MFRKLAWSALISLSVAAAYVLWRGTPSAPRAEVIPDRFDRGKATVVTVTVQTNDARFKASRVGLVRVDAHARVLSDTVMVDEDGTNTDAVPGHRFFLTMRDDGTKGDRVANDGIFTRRVTLNESSGPVYFEAQAAFERTSRHAPFDRPSRPVRSPLIAVQVNR
jgi:hypothetical protein